MRDATPGDARWAPADLAALLLAVDPVGLGGAILRGPAGPARERWLDRLTSLMPAEAPWRRMPPQIAESRLIGGLDLAATLAAGRPVAERGLLAEVAGGILVVPMAERLGANASGPLAAALDSGEVVVERDGLALRLPSRFTCVLLDEGIEDERAPDALAERLAFKLALDVPRPTGGEAESVDRAAIAAARARLDAVAVADDCLAALCEAGVAFGVPSLRVATFALRAAKAAAALAGRDAVMAEDVERAAMLIFAPRATTLPAASEGADGADDAPDTPPDDADQPATEASDPSDDQAADDQAAGDPETMSDRIVEATRAAIPAGLLAELGAAAAAPSRPTAQGRAGAMRLSARRGRPAGTKRGTPGHGVRLAVVETLRAAAPWQGLRRKAAPGQAGRILVRREDFRVGRFKQKSETVTIFVVDASGSAALHRLAEVKGAVELILADCYVRRDSVALIAFRGTKAEMILPPTRSLARAKRALAGQAGGGGTPLALAIDGAALLASAVKRKGQTPLAVFLTDGKANIGRSGRAGRSEAEVDALAAARLFRAACSSLVLDIAPRPGDQASRLAAAMGARYLPLPYADAHALSRAVLEGAPARRSNV